MEPHLDVACTNGLKGLVLAIGGDLQTKTGCTFTGHYTSTRKLMDDVGAGATPDLAIATDEAIDKLTADGKLAGGRIDIAKSFIGVAVRKGTPRPDISTADAFWRALKSAKAISRSRLGISGMHLAAMIEKYSLGAELNSKITSYDAYAGQACANGEADIAVQQISELMPVEGLDIVGPLPDELQKITMFSAGLGAGTKHPDAAKAFVAFLRSTAVAPVLRANGLEPA